MIVNEEFVIQFQRNQNKFWYDDPYFPSVSSLKVAQARLREDVVKTAPWRSVRYRIVKRTTTDEIVGR